MNIFDKLDRIIESTNNDAVIVSKIISKIMDGNSQIKMPLKNNEITIGDIITCIKRDRCLRVSKRDFGATYLEQVIGGAIRDAMPIDQINYARNIFGMDALDKDELIKQKRGILRSKAINRSRK